MIETPEHKRRWFRSQGKFDAENVTDSVLRHDALTAYLLTRLEQTLSATGPANPRPTTTRQLAAELEHDPAVNAVAEVLTGDAAPNLERLFTGLAGTEAVPYLAALRHTDSGMEKRRAWQQTWQLQRREDAGETVSVPVPPRYTSKDFRAATFWRLRGKLDVARERFVLYPDAASDDDGPATMVLGWAGWDHRQQAAALAELYQRRKRDDGWPAERLAPLLAGLDELIEWLRQWHNEPDPGFGGQRVGELFAGFVEAEARALDLTLEDLRTWRPARKAAGRTRASGSGRRGRPAAPALTPQQLLAAVAELDGPEGVAQRALAEHLGVSPTAVSRLAAPLLADGTLELTSARPKRFTLPESDS